MTLTIYNAEDIPQGSDAWHEARRGIVTASTVGKLLTSTGKVANNDTSRTLTETLVSERLTGRVEPFHETADMARGSILEPFARDLYAEHHAPVHEVGFMVREFVEGFRIGYSPDGLVGEDGLLEIKSRKPRIQINSIRSGTVPVANYAQLQAGLLVSGRAWIDYCSYSPGLPLYVKRVYPETAWLNAIRDAVDAFEESANEIAGAYRFSVDSHGYPPTTYFDPFAEEAITFG